MSSPTINRIGPWSITQGGARSAPSSNPCSNSPRRHGGRMGANLPVKPVTQYGQLQTRKPADSHLASGNVVCNCAEATRSNAASAMRSKTAPCSARPATASTGRSSGLSARRARRSTHGTGTATIQTEPTTTGAAGSFRRSTASPSRNTTRCSPSKAAYAPSAARRKQRSTAAGAHSSGSPLTTITRPERSGACFAIGAIGRSGFSKTTPTSWGRRSTTCCATGAGKSHKGGRTYCPPGHLGGQ